MDQSKEFKLPSGAYLLVGVVPYQDAAAFRDAVVRSLKGTGLAKLDKDALLAGGAAVEVLVDVFLSIAASPDIEAAVLKCGKRCLYSRDGDAKNGQAVSADLFESLEARSDFYPVAGKIFEVNVLPFFVGAFSGLREAGKARPASSPASQ